MGKIWRPLRKKLPEIPKKHLNYHICRHTFATWLAQDGISVYKIAAYIGDTVQMVLDYYIGQFGPDNCNPDDLDTLEQGIDL